MFINGEKINLESLECIHTLDDLVKYYKLEPKLIIAQRNDEICKRDNWETITLAPNDRIEFLHFIGGG